MSVDPLEALRSMVREGRFVQAVQSAEALIAERPEPATEAELQHILSVARHRLDQLWPALNAARRAESLAVEWELRELAARVRINLISFYREIGDLPLAAEAGEKLLAEQERLPAAVRKSIPRVYYNMACVCRSRRDKPGMHAHMASAISLGAELGSPASFVCQAHQQEAWWRYQEDAIAQGDEHAYQAKELLSPEDVEAVREQLLLGAFRAHQVGDMAKAVEIAEEFMAAGAPATLLQRTWSAYLLASAALHLDRIDDAEIFVSTAMDLAIELYSPEHLNMVNELRCRVVRRRETAG